MEPETDEEEAAAGVVARGDLNQAAFEILRKHRDHTREMQALLDRLDQLAEDVRNKRVQPALDALEEMKRLTGTKPMDAPGMY